MREEGCVCAGGGGRGDRREEGAFHRVIRTLISVVCF